MAVSLDPYLAFDGAARAALGFYGTVFGVEPQVMTFGDGGMSGADPDGVMHGSVATPAGTLMASDLPAGESLSRGNDVTLSLSGDDEQQLRQWWDALADGAEITAPLERAPWGDLFGMLVDRFGVRWMVDIGSPQG